MTKTKRTFKKLNILKVYNGFKKVRAFIRVYFFWKKVLNTSYKSQFGFNL